GGEALTGAALGWWGRHAPRVRVVNEYGPTEAVVGCCVEGVAAGEAAQGGAVPIGRPIANARLYVLGVWGEVVPAGAPGELYIGGAGVARGYLNRPGLTAERFVPDPFSEEPGARLYRTGDVVRHLADGRLEYLGRSDQQVKVRGFRVELGEVEAALNQHPGVREAVAAVSEEGGHRRLVGYVVPVDAEGAREELSAGELRRHLSERLPEHMVPSLFVFLDALPLTPNGKVDRKALPAPEAAAQEAGRERAAPRTPDEEILCAVWEEVLGISRIGVRDNFFDLGGHSLLATQVISRVKQIFEVELSLRNVFESPTVEGMADCVARARRSPAARSAPPLVAGRRGDATPLSFTQQRLWFLHQLDPADASYHVPVAIRLTGALDTAALGRSLTEVVRRHESLRTTFDVVEGQPVQVAAPPAEVPLPALDLSALPAGRREAEALRLAAREARLPFDLSAGPPLRAALLRLSDAEHVVLFTMHHIVSDAWSMGVLVREIAALYEAYARGEESPLSELPIQYADYAAWQRGWLQGEVLEEQLSYWRGQLEGAPPVLELPTDRPRPAVASHRGGRVSFTLGTSLSEALSRLGRREGATTYMTLLAAYKVLLSRYTGQTDLVVGTPIAGRGRAEVEPLIGFFVNTLALRARMDDDPTFAELVRRVRETCLGAYAHQDVPFEKLVEELRPERSMSYEPIFQVTFGLHNVPRADLRLPGLSLDGVGEAEPSAKYDLMLTMEEREGDLAGLFVYNSDLFDAATVERMGGHLRTLLEAVVADPGRRVSEHPLLGEDERRRLLVEFNDTRRDYPRDLCLHELFGRQVGRTPDAVALAHDGGQLTYAELDGRAERLARHLRLLGVGPEVRVAIFMSRSVEMVVSILGVLKAGGCYVPLDPEYPLGRLSFMLEDSGAAVVLTLEGLLDSLPSHRAQEVCVDSEWEAISAAGADGGDDPGVGGIRPDPDGLAYVMYTSGSTGTPKGVSVTHRNVTRLVF
ncbi:MAG TPA: condensation domain-containing protein, partial [Pyrinomonadaceae bacterium]